MYKSIKHFFENLTAGQATTSKVTPQQLHIATAAMLIEMMHMDDIVLDKERSIVTKVIHDSFSLSDQQTAEIIVQADKHLKEATDYYQFTSLINQGFDQNQKTRLIKSLWEVAFIDGHLDEHEDYMVRKVADLLHVEHNELIKLRNRTKDAHDSDSTIGC